MHTESLTFERYAYQALRLPAATFLLPARQEGFPRASHSQSVQACVTELEDSEMLAIPADQHISAETSVYKTGSPPACIAMTTRVDKALVHSGRSVQPDHCTCKTILSQLCHPP